MSKLTELFKLYDLTTAKHPAHGNAVLDRNDFKFYGEKLTTHHNYASISCDREGHYSHYFYKQIDGTLAYSWSGQNYLVSKGPISLDVLHELINAKNDELKAARQKRFEKIKTPRDALRLIFRDLGIEANMVGGVPRIDCGPFELEFFIDKENPQIKVGMVYRSYYVNKIDLTTLTIADPGLNKKVEAIVFNGRNLNKLMLGEIQPKPMEQSNG